jgi:lysyl-tRNA synthetase class 2
MYTFDPEWLAKVADLRAQGVDPFPDAAGMVISHRAAELRAQFEGVEAPELDGVSIGGRVMFRNHMGKAIFLRVQDGSGVIQAYVRRERVGDDVFARVKAVDIGDIVWISGSVMRTKTGELTVLAASYRLAAKAMTPFPDRWSGVTDVQVRSRQRYVDLMMHQESRETFLARSRILKFIRRFFDERSYVEVETPMLQSIPGGAAARPFVTHHNALDIPLYLRVAPELFLKRLVVGGIERVFEVNRNFRNEGISARHNPEFTMLEFYQAWATHHDLIQITEDLLSGLAPAITGGMVVQFGEHTIDFTPPYRRADMDELIAERTGLSRESLADPAEMAAFWAAAHPDWKAPLPTDRGRWWELLFEEYVERTLIAPTFVTGFPAEISPLARRSDADPSRCDRFEVIIAGWEVANGFSELNDPVDQAGRFADQVAAHAAAKGELDASMFFDHDYVRALSFGMPPTAGEGIGIDRLVMMLTGRTHIRDVILFPTMRPEAPS